MLFNGRISCGLMLTIMIFFMVLRSSFFFFSGSESRLKTPKKYKISKCMSRKKRIVFNFFFSHHSSLDIPCFYFVLCGQCWLLLRRAMLHASRSMTSSTAFLFPSNSHTIVIVPLFIQLFLRRRHF